MAEMSAEETAESWTAPCSQCGGHLELEPGTEQLTCSFCGAKNEIEGDGEPVVERDFLAHLDHAAAGLPTEERLTLECPGCGAETTFEANVTASHCPYCGVHIEGGGRSRRLVRPGALLPFHVGDEAAAEHFRRWLRGLWFAPGELRRFADLTGLDGVYVPYWTYDCRTHTRYRGFRGKHYWVTQSYTTTQNGRRVQRTRRVRKTRWYPVSGTVSDAFDDVLMLASQSLPRKQAEKLEPWDLGELVPYDEDYLRGFRVESYGVDLAQGFAAAQPKMDPVIRRSVCRDIGGDTQRIQALNVDYRDITFKHLLLPVWIAAYRYKGRLYRFLVNARTGEVQGERPWSVAKIVSAVGAVLLIVLAVLLLLR